MVAVILSPLYLLICVYVWIKAMKWLQSCHGFFHNRWFKLIFNIVYIFFVVSPVVAFFLPEGHLQRLMKLISNYWFGEFIYMVLFIAVADLVLFVLHKTKVIKKKEDGYKRVLAVTGAITFIAIVAMSTYGLINARITKVKNYEVSVAKEVDGIDSLNVVLIADTHLGYNIGCRMMEQMVEKVNAQNPDVVCFAGDMFDNEYSALDDPERLAEILSGIKSKYGVYAVFGNHDVEEKILAGFTFGGKKDKLNGEEMIDFMEKSNIEILRDETVLVDDSFYIVGRRDAEKPGNKEQERLNPVELTENLDKTKPIIVIDHEPRQLEELSHCGVDLDLCGHTHAGQIFPGNLTIKLMWDNAWGYLKEGDMHNFVTSGVGLFGPNMRTFTDSEIMQITVDFEEAS